MKSIINKTEKIKPPINVELPVRKLKVFNSLPKKMISKILEPINPKMKDRTRVMCSL